MTKPFHALFAASALLLAACPTARIYRPLATLTILDPPGAVAPGDTLHAVAALSNPGRDTLRLELEGDCVVEFYVRAEPGQQIVDPPGGGPPACDRAPRTLTLAPGQAKRFEHRWIAPGDGSSEYTLYAILGEHHEVRGGDREFKAGHRSNEVTVRVQR